MKTSYALTATDTLIARIARIEARLIAGSARRDEIEAYVGMQLELADREVHQASSGQGE